EPALRSWRSARFASEYPPHHHHNGRGQAQNRHREPVPEGLTECRQVAKKRHPDGAGDEEPRGPHRWPLAEDGHGCRERQVEKCDSKKRNMTKTHHAPSPGAISAQPVLAMEEASLDRAREAPEKD